MIDSPPRKRDPLQLAAKLARWSNDIELDAIESAILKDASILLRKYHDVCHRLGLTAEQLDAGVLEKLVEVTKEVHRLYQCQYADAKICPMRKLADALAPFQQEKP